MENNQDELYIEPIEKTETNIVKNDLTLNDNFVEQAGKQIELRSRLLCIALKSLKPHDIQDFDGKPYIEGEGAARIMAVIRGFKVGEAKFLIEQIHPHYFIECQIPMEFMQATTVALGDCSTADPFFTGRDGQSGQYKHHLDRTGSETMAARLIVGDAKKKARENAISRGVTELLGLKGLSWDDLGKLGFLRTEAGAKVEFKKGSQGGATGTLTVSEAIKTPAGSVINIKGTQLTAECKASAKAKFIIYTVADDVNKISVLAFGETPKAGNGQEVYCKNVKVVDKNGYKNYQAESVEPTDLEPGSNG
jgi:hypothetical protein